MINAAIAGLGWWGQTLVESVSGDSDKIRFVAGIDPFASDKTEEFTQLHDMQLLREYEAALADPKIDAVILATPHSLHTDQVVAAAKAGKHVFCEKPFALHKADAERSAQFPATVGAATARLIAASPPVLPEPSGRASLIAERSRRGSVGDKAGTGAEMAGGIK